MDRESGRAGRDRGVSWTGPGNSRQVRGSPAEESLMLGEETRMTSLSSSTSQLRPIPADSAHTGRRPTSEEDIAKK